MLIEPSQTWGGKRFSDSCPSFRVYHSQRHARGLSPRVGELASENQEVTDQDTRQAIATDKQPDATPVGLATTGAKTLYTVCTSLPESRGAALTLTGVMKVQTGNAAQARIQPAMGW